MYGRGRRGIGRYVQLQPWTRTYAAAGARGRPRPRHEPAVRIARGNVPDKPKLEVPPSGAPSRAPGRRPAGLPALVTGSGTTTLIVPRMAMHLMHCEGPSPSDLTTAGTLPAPSRKPQVRADATHLCTTLFLELKQLPPLFNTLFVVLMPSECERQRAPKDMSSCACGTRTSIFCLRSSSSAASRTSSASRCCSAMLVVRGQGRPGVSRTAAARHGILQSAAWLAAGLSVS